METTMENIMSLWQEGTVSEYCDEFDFLFNKTDISEDYAIYLFMCGLKSEIREVFMQWHQYSLQTLKDSYSLALKLDSNKLRDTFSPFDPKSSLYIEDLVFDFRKSIDEIVEMNEVSNEDRVFDESVHKMFDEMSQDFGSKMSVAMDDDANKKENNNTKSFSAIRESDQYDKVASNEDVNVKTGMVYQEKIREGSVSIKRKVETIWFQTVVEKVDQNRVWKVGDNHMLKIMVDQVDQNKVWEVGDENKDFGMNRLLHLVEVSVSDLSQHTFKKYIITDKPKELNNLAKIDDINKMKFTYGNSSFMIWMVPWLSITTDETFRDDNELVWLSWIDVIKWGLLIKLVECILELDSCYSGIIRIGGEILKAYIENELDVSFQILTSKGKLDNESPLMVLSDTLVTDALFVRQKNTVVSNDQRNGLLESKRDIDKKVIELITPLRKSEETTLVEAYGCISLWGLILVSNCESCLKRKIGVYKWYKWKYKHLSFIVMMNGSCLKSKVHMLLKWKYKDLIAKYHWHNWKLNVMLFTYLVSIKQHISNNITENATWGVSSLGRHLFGYFKERFVCSLVCVVGIFCNGSGSVIVNRAQNLWTLQPGGNTMRADLVLGCSVIIDVISLTGVVHAVSTGVVAEGMTMQDYLWCVLDPTCVAFLLVDGAVDISLVIGVALLVLKMNWKLIVYQIGSFIVGNLLRVWTIFLIQHKWRMLIGLAIDVHDIEGGPEFSITDPLVGSAYDGKSEVIGPGFFRFKAKVDFGGVNDILEMSLAHPKIEDHSKH